MSALSRYVSPPRLRTADTGRDRRATWLELFFDLVFVVAVAELGHNLDADPTAGGFLEYLALFVPVWWAWAGFTFYANRFDTDDLPYRLQVFAGMFAVAALATGVHDALSPDATTFAVAYIAIRLIIISLYVRAIPHLDEGRELARLYVVRFGVAVGIWIGSLLVEPPLRWWLWALALAIELSAPAFGWRLLPRAPIDPRHVPERFGLLTIIVLGESIIAVVAGVADTSWSAGSVSAAAAGFVAAAAIWWIYFDFLDESMVGRGIARGLTFTYAHLPVVAGIAALGVGVKLAILSAGGESAYDDTGWIMCAGLAIAMLGLAAIQLATPPALLDVDVWLRIGTAAFALALIPAALRIHALWIAVIVALVLVAQVVVELAQHPRHAHHDGGLELELHGDEPHVPEVAVADDA